MSDAQRRRRTQLRQEQAAADREVASVRVIEVAPAAPDASLKPRHKIMFASFALIVILPVVLATYYLFWIAADQYASKVGFTVRTEEAQSALEMLGGLTQLSGSSSTDTDILYEFIQSQEMVSKVNDRLDIRAMYRKPDGDPLFTLGSDDRIEHLIDFWQSMVRVFYDPGTGLIEVEARAFAPDDAQAIAQEVFQLSSEMINRLSTIARDDTTRYAKDELDLAVERLKVARQAITRFRNDTQIVDPTADIQGQMGVVNSLQAQLAESLVELDLLSGSTRDSDPRVEQARRRIEVIERRIVDERQKLGVGGGQPGSAYADVIGQFESLSVDLEFAQNAYISALSAYDASVAEARRQSRYLAAYVVPTLPQTPLYPKRSMILLVLGLILFAIWMISVLIFYSLKDRR